MAVETSSTSSQVKSSPQQLEIFKSGNSPEKMESTVTQTHGVQNTINPISDTSIGPEVSVKEELNEADTEITAAAEDEQVENAIRPVGVKASLKGIDEIHQNSSNDNRIIKILPSTKCQTTASKSDNQSPIKLLNKRFVLGENGEYRRLGETRVALVDEIEQIRFIDKQIDAFQAGVDLAKLKGWQAIEITGTEKFRSEAWFHARMADLEVVGHEPNDSDLNRLEMAQNRQKLTDKNVEESRSKAINFAIKRGAGLQETNEEVGCYSGPIMLETDYHFVQDIGRKVAVLHEKNCFNSRELSQALSNRGSLKVQYQAGHGVVSKGRSHDHEFSR